MPLCRYIVKCKKNAVYGEKPGKPIFCGVHRTQGWLNVIAPRCFCGTIATWGREGTKTKLYCAKHGQDQGMVDVANKQCAHLGCNTLANFAFEGDPAKYCGTHAEEGMENVNSKQCEVDGCDTQPSYGRGGLATHCGKHAEEGMIDVKNKKCVSCGLFYVNKAPYLCSYCNPNTSKYQKTREMTVKALLEFTTDLNNPIHDKPIGGECGKYRPDFLYDAVTHRVVVEVDEDQHRSYDPECERIRMINILGALEMRCVFIRYNPDVFHIDGKTVRVYEKKRHELLLKTIREYMNPSFDPQATADVVYLYYDGAEVRTDALTF
jgi:hypothetical protein